MAKIDTESRFRHLEAFAERKCSDWSVPGLALLAAHQGEIDYRHMHGYRNVEQQLPVTEDTVFGVASITKSVAALAIMQAQDQHLLSVDDPIIKWLPELAESSQEYMDAISVHHLLTHTSGFPGMSTLFRARAKSIQRDRDWKITARGMPNPFEVETISTCEDLIQVLNALDFTFLAPPGTIFNYSNEGYALLQGILERATGESFLNWAHENILGPLEMHNSVFRTEDLALLPEVTQLYATRQLDGHNTVFESPAWWDVGEIYTNGSLKSSASDMIRYLEVYRNEGLVKGNRIISPESFRQMTTKHVQLPTGHGYGYGIRVNDHHGIKILAHDGGIKGVSSTFVVTPKAKTSIIALANMSGLPVSQLATASLNDAIGLPLETPIVEYQAAQEPMAEMDPYIGHYQSDEGDAADIRLHEENLIMDFNGDSMKMVCFGKDGFVNESGTLPIRFLRDKSGNINSLFVGVRVLPRRCS